MYAIRSYYDLKEKKLEPVYCESEEAARKFASEEKSGNEWPCYFSSSDTTGEKDYEEFYTGKETVDLERYNNLGVVKNSNIKTAAEISYNFV